MLGTMTKHHIAYNCSIYYFDGLRFFDSPKAVLRDMFSVEGLQYGQYSKALTFQMPCMGRQALFLQGCEHAKNYLSPLLAYIAEHKLGTVFRTGPTYNPIHRKYGETAIWDMDPSALRAWWDTHIGTENLQTDKE